MTCCTASVCLLLVSGFIFLEFQSVVASDKISDLLSKRLTVARCRAFCLNKFLIETPHYARLENNGGCTSKANWKCNMCWDYCEMLIVNRIVMPDMCKDTDICFDGCQHACTFHQKYSSSKLMFNDIHISSPKITPTKISWNSTKDVTRFQKNTVFAVFGIKLNSLWQEIEQTADKAVNWSMHSSKFYKIAIFGVTTKGISFTTKMLTLISRRPRFYDNAHDEELLKETTSKLENQRRPSKPGINWFHNNYLLLAISCSTLFLVSVVIVIVIVLRIRTCNLKSTREKHVVNINFKNKLPTAVFYLESSETL